jgi:SNF2 family DNA or RNA helicase
LSEPLALWAHQKHAVALALKQRDFALFHEQGTGKTGTLINILRHKYAEKGHIRRTLILTPLVTLGNWKREFKLFSRVNPTDVVVLQGSGARKNQILLDAITEPVAKTLTRNRIIIANYEVVQNADFMQIIQTWCPELVVCDEAHRLRNHQSKRAKLVCQITDRAEHRYILTGTPILNTAQDIFHQYRIMDRGETFGDNFYAFRGRYFEDENARRVGKPGYFPSFIERPDCFDELHRKMYSRQGMPIAHRVLKKDCLDLPPLVKTKVEVELSSEQARLYKEMRDEYLTFVANKKAEGQPLAVVAQLAITKALRLQQITTGYVKADDGNEYDLQDNPRLQALSELLDDSARQQKVIVWAAFKNNYKQIIKVCEKLGLQYTLLTGDQSAKEKEENMHTFRTVSNVTVMIANQSAGGIGVNLVEAPVAIFYSRNFSLEQDLQAEARNFRGGSEMHNKITRIDLIAKNTIDESIAEALANKQNLADKILDMTI